MQRVFLFISVSFLVCSTQAQDIFKKHGFEKEPLTLSKGRYEEMFTNKEVVQIGSVLLNTKTNKVIEFLNEETDETSFKTEHSSRWLSPDPLAEKYPWISPYAFCFNNPVKYIDPDGRDAMLVGSGTREDPYVITARYYYQNGSLNDAQVKGLNDGLAAYNNSGKNGVTEIKNADGSKSYVRYDLSAEGVDDIGAAKATTAFETTSGDTRYYGNVVGTDIIDKDSKEFGSADNLRIDFNVDNINAGIAGGLNSKSLNKGVAIHEVGHNLGGEHSDGTSVMNQTTTTTTFSQIGGTTTVSHSYSSMSAKFTKIILDRRDTPFSTTGNIWTKKP